MDLDEQEKQFILWLEKYRASLIKITRSFADMADDFDDLFQEISPQLWRSAPSFQNDSSDEGITENLDGEHIREYKR